MKVIATFGILRGLGYIEGFAGQINDCLGVRVVAIWLNQAGEFDGFDDVS